jgi:hypothetical protein
VSVSESQRHQLFSWFEGAMGPENAAVMMDLLPPVGWADLATKADLQLFEARMEHQFARLQKNMYLSMLASNVTVVGLVLAVLQLR